MVGCSIVSLRVTVSGSGSCLLSRRACSDLPSRLEDITVALFRKFHLEPNALRFALLERQSPPRLLPLLEAEAPPKGLIFTLPVPPSQPPTEDPTSCTETSMILS